MPKPLTSEELDELERLDIAATPRPWHRFSISGHGHTRHGVANESLDPFEPTPEDWRMIASIRNALPALIAAARENAKLPETADGVRIVPDILDGPTVWHPKAGKMECFWQDDVSGVWMAQDSFSMDVGGLEDRARPVSECYANKGNIPTLASPTPDKE